MQGQCIKASLHYPLALTSMYPSTGKPEKNIEDFLLKLPFQSGTTALDHDSLYALAHDAAFRSLFSRFCNELCFCFSRKSLDCQLGIGTTDRLSRVFLYYTRHDECFHFNKSSDSNMYLLTRSVDIVEALRELSLELYPFSTQQGQCTPLRVRAVPVDPARGASLLNAIGHCRICYILTLLSLFVVEQKGQLNINKLRFSLSIQFEEGKTPSNIEPHTLAGNNEVQEAHMGLRFCLLGLEEIKAKNGRCVFKTVKHADEYVGEMRKRVYSSLNVCFTLIGRDHGIHETHARCLTVALLRASGLTTARFYALNSPEGAYEDHTAKNFHRQFLSLAEILRESYFNYSNLLVVEPGLLYQLCDCVAMQIDAVFMLSRVGSSDPKVIYDACDMDNHWTARWQEDSRIILDSYAPDLYRQAACAPGSAAETSCAPAVVAAE